MTARFKKRNCPGCNETYYIRDPVADPLCDSCTELLMLGKETKQRARETASDLTVLCIGSGYLYGASDQTRDHDRYSLKRAVYDIVGRLANDATGDRSASVAATPPRAIKSIYTSSFDHNPSFPLLPADAVLIETLIDEINYFGGLSYQEGVNKGNGLLTKLASGEATMSEYNRIVLEGKK